MKQSWSQSEADIYVAPPLDEAEAFRRCSHLAIGAHQDDLEIMAVHGILKGNSPGASSFSGVVATDGRGSARMGDYERYSDEEMRLVRRDEQRRAARLGNYAALVQLDHKSSLLRTQQGRLPFVQDLLRLFSIARPEIVYTHSLTDSHNTHVSIALGVIEALRQMSSTYRPSQLVGCEVWQDLDWLPEAYKVSMDVSSEVELQRQLLECFPSQIAGGKRYDLAALGRRRAHATFCASHQVDRSSGVIYGMDLGPLLKDGDLDPLKYVSFLCEEFHQQKLGLIRSLI